MPNSDEFSPSGAPILRHGSRKPTLKGPACAGRNLEDIEAHLQKHIGPVKTVFHEISSDLIHLDVLLVPASAKRRYHVLVTSGVGDRRMTVPEAAENYGRAELLIALPAAWPLAQGALMDEANYWPVRWLKRVGRLPHEHDTWIGWGHTIPNGDPPATIGSTRFVGFMLTPPFWLDDDFFQLHARSGDTVTFYDLVPLYKEEMEMKLNRGVEVLEDLLDKADAWGALDVSRRNVAK